MSIEYTYNNDIEVWLKALSVVNKENFKYAIPTIPCVVFQYKKLASEVLELNPDLLDDERLYEIDETRSERERIKRISIDFQGFYYDNWNDTIKHRFNELTTNIALLPRVEIKKILTTKSILPEFKEAVFLNCKQRKPLWIRDTGNFIMYEPYIAQEVIRKHEWWIINQYDVNWLYQTLCQIACIHPYKDRNYFEWVDMRKDFVEYIFDEDDWDEEVEVNPKKPMLVA